MDTLPPGLADLSSAEKLALVDALWDSLLNEDVSLTGSQRANLRRRLTEHRFRPDCGQSWEDVKSQLLRDCP